MHKKPSLTKDNHPYSGHKERGKGKERVHKLYGDEGLKSEHKPLGYARGGKVKHGGKGHHTKINIVVAPKGGADGPPPPMMPPPGAGAPPPGAGAPPPMPPKTPMGPPPGGPMGGGMPGIGMKRGGGVRPHSGIASKENLKQWSDYASKNTRYERGGAIHGVGAGAGTAVGRMRKQKAYGKNARKGS